MSRRDQIRMTEPEFREFLGAAKTIILNSIGRDGVPHPMPMWFSLADDGTIAMTTFSKSQKIQNLRRDPRVSLLVEAGSVYNELRGVVIYGHAELVSDVEEVTDILIGVSGRQGQLAEGAAPDVVREGLKGTAAKRTGIRVKPERVVSWDHSKLGGTY